MSLHANKDKKNILPVGIVERKDNLLVVSNIDYGKVV